MSGELSSAVVCAGIGRAVAVGGGVLTPRATSIAGFIALVAAMVVLFSRHELFASSPFCFALQLAAIALMIWARLTFGRRSFHAAANPTEGELVTRGPYAFLRHPIYASILLFVAAAFLSSISWRTALALLLAISGAMSRIAAEEHLLRARYPEYASYAARTKRLVPLVF